MSNPDFPILQGLRPRDSTRAKKRNQSHSKPLEDNWKITQIVKNRESPILVE